MVSLSSRLRHVLLVDDNEFNRDGIALYLSGHGYVIHEAANMESAVRVWESARPGVAVIDIVIPPDTQSKYMIDLSVGIQLARRLKEFDPTLAVVLFSAQEDRGAEVWELVNDGVRGIAYLFKGARPERLLEAIEETAAGHVVLDGMNRAARPQYARELLSRLSPEEQPWVVNAVARLPTLTGREMQVAQRVAAAQSVQRIAEALGIERKTVENHISNVYRKLGLDGVDQSATGLRKATLLAKAFMIYDLMSDREDA